MAPKELVAAIHDFLSDEVIVTQALEAISIQACNGRDNELVGAEAHTAAVKAMNAHAASPGVTEQFSGALRNLAYGSNAVKEIPQHHE
jgi:hypothetical protein